MTSSFVPEGEAETRAERRAAAGARAASETGITAAMIEAMVEAFYAAIERDARLGPIFALRIADWAPHLARMKRFWRSVMLHSGEYQGRPMAIHAALPIEDADFAAWLALFRRTASAQCPPDAAAALIARAERIADSLRTGLEFARRAAL